MVRIFQIICPQAHIGIRMDIHMIWIEEIIAIGSLFKINPSVKTEVQTALARISPGEHSSRRGTGPCTEFDAQSLQAFHKVFRHILYTSV